MYEFINCITWWNHIWICKQARKKPYISHFSIVVVPQIHLSLYIHIAYPWFLQPYPSISPSAVVKPIFSFCPRNRTALIERGGPSVAVWWLEPEAVDRYGNILSDVKVNSQPGELFKPGLSFVTYTATDSEGRKSMCTFFITVERQGRWKICFHRYKTHFISMPSYIYINISYLLLTLWRHLK